MSAWIVGKDEIDLLVTAVLVLRNNGEPLKGTEAILKSAEAIGQEFMDENYASVNYRYSENEVAPAYEFTPVTDLLGDPTKIPAGAWEQVLASAHCLIYQSCEHPEWGESVAYRTLSAVLASVAGKVRIHSDGAKWGWTRWDGFPE